MFHLVNSDRLNTGKVEKGKAWTERKVAYRPSVSSSAVRRVRKRNETLCEHRQGGEG